VKFALEFTKLASIKKFALRNWILTLLLFLLTILLLVHPVPPAYLIQHMDYRTLLSLAGLLMITRGLELSGFFDHLAGS